MGVCESNTKEKDKEKNISQNSPIPKPNKILKKEALNEEENSNNLETYPSSNSQENENKCPNLIKYDQDPSGKKSEISFVNSKFSNQNEEEVIIRGEINKENINKEGDFDNMDFKNLVKKNGGIVVKEKDKMSNVYSYQGINPAFDFGQEKLSEIKSMNSFACRTNFTTNTMRGSDAYLNLINKRRQFENNNNQRNINDFLQNKEDKLRDSCKVNVSMHDANFRNDAFISIPKNDEPLPDIDELSTESPLLRRSSLISD